MGINISYQPASISMSVSECVGRGGVHIPTAHERGPFYLVRRRRSMITDISKVRGATWRLFKTLSSGDLLRDEEISNDYPVNVKVSST
jgi:hypothetical protein